MARPIPVFELAGIRVTLDPSWFLIFLLVAWSLATGYLPQQLPGAGTTVLWTLGGGLALPVEPRNLKIDLMNDQHTPSLSWTVERAWPLRWEVSSLNSQDNKLLVETLELSYNYFFRS